MTVDDLLDKAAEMHTDRMVLALIGLIRLWRK